MEKTCDFGIHDQEIKYLFFYLLAEDQVKKK